MAIAQIPHTSDIFTIGEQLAGGTFIETPFDEPYEEEKFVDMDALEDNRNFGADSRCVPHDVEKNPAFLSKYQDKKVLQHPMLKYFLDGSLRTKFLGEYVDGTRSFPLLVAEIASCVVKLDGIVINPAGYRKKIFFIFPSSETGLITTTKYDLLESEQKRLKKSKSNIVIEFSKMSEEHGIRWSMQGKARELMHETEQELAQTLQRKEDEWLVMDGAIRKAEFFNLPKTIGLAKSFSAKPTFTIGKKNYNITSLVTKLKENDRTCAFKPVGPENSLKDLLFWYLRLRIYPPMAPVGGIVKIDGNPADIKDSSFINQISTELLYLRNPSVYPNNRWPSYIYPIYVVEQFMRNLFLGNQMLGLYAKIIKKSVKQQKAA